MATLKHILWSVIFPFSYFKYKAEKDVVSGPVWTWRVPCGTGKMPPTGCSAGLFTRIHTPLFFCRSWRPRRPGERFYRSTQKGFRGFRSFGRLHSGGFWESGGFPGSWECSLFSRQQWLRCFACPWEEKQEGGLGLQGEASQFIQELGAQQVRPLPAGPLLSLALLLSVRIPEWPWASAGRPQPRLPKPALLLWLVVSFARAALGTAAPSFLLLRAAYCGPCGSDNPWPSLLEKDKEDVWEVSVFSLRSASGF